MKKYSAANENLNIVQNKDILFEYEEIKQGKEI